MRKSVYHGLQRVGSRRPFGNAAIRGARRIAENSNFEIPSASERAISAVTRDLSESSLQNRGRKSKERSLQQIPGVGPRNEQLFISAGVASVPTLVDIFFESMDGDKDLMRAFIQATLAYRLLRCLSVLSGLKTTTTSACKLRQYGLWAGGVL